MKPLTRYLTGLTLSALALSLTFLALPSTQASAGGRKGGKAVDSQEQ
jgi:hypothetical protein